MKTEDAIKVLSRYDICLIGENGEGVKSEELVDAFNTAVDALKQQVTGKWEGIYAESDYCNDWIEFTCPNCKHRHRLENEQYEWNFDRPIPWKFCPVCGCRMEDESYRKEN